MEERWTTTYVLPTIIVPDTDESVPEITWRSILAWTGS
jgi:hypothetical protein